MEAAEREWSIQVLQLIWGVEAGDRPSRSAAPMSSLLVAVGVGGSHAAPIHFIQVEVEEVSLA